MKFLRGICRLCTSGSIAKYIFQSQLSEKFKPFFVRKAGKRDVAISSYSYNVQTLDLYLSVDLWIPSIPISQGPV